MNLFSLLFHEVTVTGIARFLNPSSILVLLMGLHRCSLCRNIEGLEDPLDMPIIYASDYSCTIHVLYLQFALSSINRMRMNLIK